MRGENKKEESVSECDVGLGLRMQSTESLPHKSTIVTPHLPYSTLLYHHHNYKKENNTSNFVSSPCFERMSSDRTSTRYGFGAGDGGGGPLYSNLTNNNKKQVACLSDLYNVVGDSGEGSVLRTFLPLANTYDSYPKSSGGIGVDDDNNNNNKGISAFTVRQWEELERQIMICKCMMASVPVPPHLLLTLSNTISSAVSASQSNYNTTSCRLDVGYTRGGGISNDAEPWRCRRTDGKKWRCSRDVAPYQRYCERHAHKPRPRSRKPVEPQQQEECHITTTNVGANSINSNNSTPHQALQSQIFDIPAMISGPTYAQPRCTEWFMKGGPVPGSALNEAWQQLVQPSPSEGFKLYLEHDRTASVFQKRYEEEQESILTNSYLCTNDDSSFRNRLNFDHQAQMRHFINASSCADREVDIGHISNQTPLSLSGTLPLSSLSLSMSGGTEIDDGNKNVQLGVGMTMMIDPEGGNGKCFKTDWHSSNPYLCLPPGGPLGEALCLGISSTGNGQSNLPSPHGYSNSTATSSCSKSS